MYFGTTNGQEKPPDVKGKEIKCQRIASGNSSAIPVGSQSWSVQLPFNIALYTFQYDSKLFTLFHFE